MKRVLPSMLFLAIVVAWVTMNSGETPPAYLRVVLVGAMGVLVIWKAGEFWERHRQEPEALADRPESPGTKSDRAI